MATLSTKIEFFKYYNIVKRQILAYFQKQLSAKEGRTMDYLEKVLDYNVPHGKLNRGVMLVQAYEYLNDFLPMDNVRVSGLCKIGWAIEMLHSSFLILDDVIDSSFTRRGQPCWYKVPQVGMKAVNDGLILENCVDLMVHQELHDKTYCGKAKLATLLGQHLDSQKFEFEYCTPSLYADIVRLKTSHYTFLLPVILAVHMCSDIVADNVVVNETELTNLCYKLGHYFQTQDDYLDCFGDPSVTGKIGTDIKDGKCSWFLVEALQIMKTGCSEFQELKTNYGQPNDGHESVVKSVYEKLNLLERYKKFESEYAKDIEKSISLLTTNCLRPFFQNVLDDLRGRKR